MKNNDNQPTAMLIISYWVNIMFSSESDIKKPNQ